MGNKNDRMFVWRELTTTDVDAALRFYGELFGWKAQKAPMDGFTYWLLHSGDKQVAGAMGMMPGMAGVAPYWGSYVEVADVDTACRTAVGLGGKVMNGPHDLADVGRMAAIMDPQGGMFSVIKSAGDPPAMGMPGPSQFCWETLNATDVAAAKAFYTKVVGWKTMPFKGGDPATEVFTTGASEGGMAADVSPAPAGTPTHWMTYVAVDDLAAARERTKRLGGKVLAEKIEVPTVGFIAMIQDPQGAVLGLFAEKA